jgi:hypothetical protein
MAPVFSTYWPTVEAIETDLEKVKRAMITIQALAAGLDIARLVAYKGAVERGIFSDEVK